MIALLVMLSAATTAFLVAMYAVDGSVWYLGGAIYCGALTLFNIMQARDA